MSDYFVTDETGAPLGMVDIDQVQADGTAMSYALAAAAGWMPRLRGWSCQERTARDVAALAERRGYDVIVTGPRTRKERLRAVLEAAPPPRQYDLPDPAGGLW